MRSAANGRYGRNGGTGDGSAQLMIILPACALPFSPPSPCFITPTSLLFFFDMPPVSDVDKIYSGGGSEDGAVHVQFKNECGRAAELYWVGGTSEHATLVERDWPHNDVIQQQTFAGHTFEARDQDGNTLQRFVVDAEEKIYVLEESRPVADEL